MPRFLVRYRTPSKHEYSVYVEGADLEGVREKIAGRVAGDNVITHPLPGGGALTLDCRHIEGFEIWPAPTTPVINQSEQVRIRMRQEEEHGRE